MDRRRGARGAWRARRQPHRLLPRRAGHAAGGRAEARVRGTRARADRRRAGRLANGRGRAARAHLRHRSLARVIRTSRPTHSGRRPRCPLGGAAAGVAARPDGHRHGCLLPLGHGRAGVALHTGGDGFVHGRRGGRLRAAHAPERNHDRPAAASLGGTGRGIIRVDTAGAAVVADTLGADRSRLRARRLRAARAGLRRRVRGRRPAARHPLRRRRRHRVQRHPRHSAARRRPRRRHRASGRLLARRQRRRARRARAGLRRSRRGHGHAALRVGRPL